MGLFDRRDGKKKGDAFDSPVETIDLDAPPPDPELSATEPVADELEPTADYGIDQAMKLMRTLPQENVELVVSVVKTTLESLHIKLPRIIEEAGQRQEDIQGRIQVLRGEIAELEKEIAARREEIASLEADYEETSTVKERLVLAEELGRGGGPKRGKPATEPTSGKRGSEHPDPPGKTRAEAVKK